MANLAGSIQARYDKALREFNRLEGVDNDPLGRLDGTVSTLVYITQFEIDLVEAGDNDAHWGRSHAKESCPTTCERCKQPRPTWGSK